MDRDSDDPTRVLEPGSTEHEDAHAYVLRLRVDASRSGDEQSPRLRLVEVVSDRTWNFHSPDAALARLRARLGAILRLDARRRGRRAGQLRR